MDSKVEQLHSWAEDLAAKFQQGDEKDCIDEAISFDREALDLCPSGHPKRSVSLMRLSCHLGDRHTQFRTIADLEEIIVLDREALELHPPGHPYRPMSLNNLALHLTVRYEELGAIKDLDEAIAIEREGLELHSLGHPDRSMSLDGLAVGLYTRYQRLGNIGDFDEAISLARDALALRPPGHQNRSKSLNNLATYLSTRYERLGAVKDLNEAIALHRDALMLRLSENPDRALSLDNLAIDLTVRYQQLGAVEDLNEAIVLGRSALALFPRRHPGRPRCLNNLAIRLTIRYNHLSTMTDLEEAISLGRDVLVLRPPGHSERAIALNNLASSLSARYKQLGDMKDLDEAIALERDALDLYPPGHPARSISLNGLAIAVSYRYRQLGTIEDLDESIILGRDTLALIPPGHPGRPKCLNNLAFRLSTRYKHLGLSTDLDEAILLDRDAITLCPPGHPDHSTSLTNLADHLRVRFMQLNQSKDKEELFTLYSQLARIPPMMCSAVIDAVRGWISAAEYFHHPTTLLAYQTCLCLLIRHLATLPSLPQHHAILKELMSSLAVDAFSASLRHHSPVDAVELLEQGRGVFWNQLVRLRSPLDDVTASGPEGKILADEFRDLASYIHQVLDSPGTNQHDRMCNLNIELQKVVARIRTLPTLSHFLLPLAFPDLQHVACEGPVIIVNSSKYSCDALVVLFNRNPVHIPLSITKEGVRELSSKFHALTVRAKWMDVTRDLCVCLRELWDEVVSPIVTFLRTVHLLQSRIWWCPTAEFSSLPLHAAGPFRNGQRKLADLYISSYTPTLSALIRARRHDPSCSPAEEERRRFVAIGQAKPVAESELFSVSTELANVAQCVDGLATFSRIEGEESCISRVTEVLGQNEWVHFACHGIANPKRPFESAFALHDGHFTIEHIIRCDLRNSEFAYLSACHTTVGDEESPDEVIHLASAMQFAGFRSVVGTMWAVDDGRTEEITSTFYAHMKDESGRLDYTRAALALNRTMKHLPDVPFDQRILYIHLGA